MKGLSIITGGLVGLAAPVLVVGATVGANVLSISKKPFGVGASH
jgi:hypothetical protein